MLRLNKGAKYLEVGVANGATLEAVHAVERVGVDPWPVFATWRLPDGVAFERRSSDTYFRALSADQRFDAILLDGFHEGHQTYRDLVNALLHLAPKGFIIIDDTVPADSVAAMPSENAAIETAFELGLPFPRPWMGDVYRVVHEISSWHPFIEYYTWNDSGRPQTVLWFQEGMPPQGLDSLEMVPKSRDVAYDERWVRNIPMWFHATKHDQILDCFAAHVRSFHRRW